VDGIFTWKFWKDALERAISTGVQAGVASIPVSTLLVQEVRWDAVASTAGLAAVLSVCKAIVASRIGRSDTASLVD
jgi:hypothetical protein